MHLNQIVELPEPEEGGLNCLQQLIPISPVVAFFSYFVFNKPPGDPELFLMPITWLPLDKDREIRDLLSSWGIYKIHNHPVAELKHPMTDGVYQLPAGWSVSRRGAYLIGEGHSEIEFVITDNMGKERFLLRYTEGFLQGFSFYGAICRRYNVNQMLQLHPTGAIHTGYAITDGIGYRSKRKPVRQLINFISAAEADMAQEFDDQMFAGAMGHLNTAFPHWDDEGNLNYWKDLST